MKTFKLVLIAALIAFVSTIAAAQTDPNSVRRSSDTGALMGEFNTRQQSARQKPSFNQNGTNDFVNNFRQWQMGSFNSGALNQLNLGGGGFDLSMLSQTLDWGINALGSKCAEYHVDCSWLLNLSSNSFSTLANLTPEQIMNVSTSAVDKARDYFGDNSADFNTYKSQVEAFYKGVAGMEPNERKKYLESLDQQMVGR